MPALTIPFGGKSPKIHSTAFIAPNAALIGDVTIGARSSIWYGCVLRGDENSISIGHHTNLQDGTIVHIDSRSYPTVIGSNVTIGHLCLIHAATLEDGCFIGMRAVVMDGAVIESGAMVAAGALVTPGKRVKSGQLWAGSPARRLRDLSPEDQVEMALAAQSYVKFADAHKRACSEAGIG